MGNSTVVKCLAYDECMWHYSRHIWEEWVAINMKDVLHGGFVVGEGGPDYSTAGVYFDDPRDLVLFLLMKPEAM